MHKPSKYDFLNFPPLNKSDVLNENLFNNRYITIGGKTIGKEFAFLQESNLNKIEDIFDPNTNNLLGHFQLCIKCNGNINMLSY